MIRDDKVRLCYGRDGCLLGKKESPDSRLFFRANQGEMPFRDETHLGRSQYPHVSHARIR
jgi:hypothetical protein